jgi:RNA polymerase sigma-70 factor (ECF subfamily)
MVAAVDLLTGLARRAQAGDPEALQSFVQASYDQVWRFCAVLVGEDAAHDSAQETFVRAVRSLNRFREESSAQTWLLAIARHVCVDELRRGSRRGRRVAPMEDVRAPVLADPAAEMALTDLLGHLDLERRAAFVLTQVVGLSYAEAAKVCDCPVGTIRSRLARARSDLVAMLAQANKDSRPGRPSPA